MSMKPTLIHCIFLFGFGLMWFSCMREASAVSYEVKPYGSGNFLTIQACVDAAVNPGDSCIVFAGDYQEHVKTKASGRSGEFISIKAAGLVTMQGFDVLHSYISIEGFDVTGFHATTGHIRVADAHDVRIVGNTIRDGITISLDDVSVRDQGPQDILHSAKGGFLSSRLRVGDMVSIQCRDVNNVSVLLSWVSVVGISQNDLNVQDVGASKDGPLFCYLSIPVIGIVTTRTSSKVEISKNVITNLDVGDLSFLEISGSDHVVDGNDINKLNGGDAFRLFGKNHVIKNNYIHDSVKKRAANNHPDIFQVFALLGNATESSNMLIQNNFITRHSGYQLAQLVPILTDASGPYSELIRNWRFLNNVITEIDLGSTFSIPDEIWNNNTFYRVNTEGSSALILGTYALNALIKNNIFLGNGAKDSPSAGWYGSTVQAVRDSIIAHHNFVSGLPPGFPPKQKRATYCAAEKFPSLDFCEQTGINGGDPQLQNINNPVGSDGTPFTNDDGLIPLLGSRLCTASDVQSYVGAYPCKSGTSNTKPMNPRALRVLP